MSFPSPLKLHLIGDSIVQNMYANTTARALITSGTNATGETLGGTITLTNQAVNGDIVQGQTTLWRAHALRGDPTLSAVFVQCGVNNIKGGDQAHLVMGLMEALIEDIRTNNPGAKILMSQMTPAGIYLDGLSSNHRGNLDIVNSLYAARYGADRRMHNMFEDPRSPGNLWTEFDSGDGIHPQAIGYYAQAKQIRIWMDQLFPDSATTAYARMTARQSPETLRIIDLASTRLAASAYTAPDNAGIAAASAAATTAASSASSAATSAATAATAASAALTAASSAASSAASALAMATHALHAALGLYLVVEPLTWDGADSETVRVRLYDSKAHALANDGVTGLAAPSFVRTISYNSTTISGDAHRPTLISGVEP